MKKMLTSSILLLVVGCTTTPITSKFDGKWTIVETPNEPVRACLEKNDVKKLRELLVRCEAEYVKEKENR